MARIDGEIVIAVPAEQVFDMVADERNEPRYNPRIARAEKTSPGPVGCGTRFTAQPRGTGTVGVMTVEITDYDRPRRLATAIRSSYLDVDGTLTFVLGNAVLHLVAAPSAVPPRAVGPGRFRPNCPWSPSPPTPQARAVGATPFGMRN